MMTSNGNDKLYTYRIKYYNHWGIMMGRILHKAISDFEDHKELNNLEFHEHYSSIFSYSVNLDRTKNKEYIKNRKKICSFCSRSKTQGATFSHDAHIIPAFFNNPKLYSIEECDDCNHKFGELYEKMVGEVIIPHSSLS